MKARIKAKKVFRNKDAQWMYEKISKDSHVYEYGIDTNGMIYFAWLNGLVERHTRRDFIKMAKEYRNELMNN